MAYTPATRLPTGIPGFDDAMRANDADVARRIAEADAANKAKVSAAKRNFWTKGALMAGAFAGAPALSGLFAGAGAAGAGAGTVNGLQIAPYAGGVAMHAPGAATAAAGAGKFATLGKIFNSRGAELGVNAGLSIFGQRAQTKAADQARADALGAQRESIALQRQQLEAELRNADLDRADAQALNAAINELKKRELDASEEERAYRRGREETEDRRLQPYRQVSEQALQQLQRMWGLGG